MTTSPTEGVPMRHPPQVCSSQPRALARLMQFHLRLYPNQFAVWQQEPGDLSPDVKDCSDVFGHQIQQLLHRAFPYLSSCPDSCPSIAGNPARWPSAFPRGQSTALEQIKLVLAFPVILLTLPSPAGGTAERGTSNAALPVRVHGMVGFTFSLSLYIVRTCFDTQFGNLISPVFPLLHLTGQRL